MNFGYNYVDCLFAFPRHNYIRLENMYTSDLFFWGNIEYKNINIDIEQKSLYESLIYNSQMNKV